MTTGYTIEGRTSDFHVLISRAKMPGKCMGGSSYQRIGLLESPKGVIPSTIRDNPRQGIRVRYTWERRYRGRTDRCAAQRAEDTAFDRGRTLAMEQALNYPTLDSTPTRCPCEEL